MSLLLLRTLSAVHALGPSALIFMMLAFKRALWLLQ
jgi:hypothetical protein